MKKRQLIFLVVFLLVCLVIIISVIGIDTTSDAAANKGKIVTVPMMSSIQTAVSEGTKWLYCGADSSFSETLDSGGETTKRTKCGPSDDDWRSCRTTTSLTGNIEFDHTGESCREECGKLGHLSWGMWSWDGESESTCWCGDGEVTPHHCTYRAGTCREITEEEICTIRSECIDYCDSTDGYCGDDGFCLCSDCITKNDCREFCGEHDWIYGTVECRNRECFCSSQREDVTCFVAGTKITMADGNLKNIEDVKIGEKVKGQNSINTVIGYERPIIGSRSTYIINNKVEFTGDHPFLTKGGWKVADLELYYNHPRCSDIKPTQLKVGDVLITEEGEESIKTLEKRKTRPADEIVYDLKLDGDNTYIADGYVVHNCEGGCFNQNTKILLANGYYKTIKDIKIGDLVLSYDIESNEFKPDRVIKIFGPKIIPQYYLINNQLMVGQNHPIIVNGEWKLSEDIKKGDMLLDKNLNNVLVTEMNEIESDIVVYYFHVEKYKTYIADDIIVSGSPIKLQNFGNKVGGT